MFNPTEAMVNTCIERLQHGYRQTYGSLMPDCIEILGWAGNMALEMIANSDAPYHNVEHTVLVTLAGQEILLGKQMLEGNVSYKDWLNAIVSLLCHDIGYVRGICRQDRPSEGAYATGVGDTTVYLPFDSTDASLTPFHVDRGKLFIEEQFSDIHPSDREALKRNIELTRFPVPKDEEHSDTNNYPGLVRAADLIGQLADPRYLQKIPALFYEFEETGANKAFGYHSPADLRKNYPAFFWNVVSPYIKSALRYLEVTQSGKQIIANLYANVFRVEHASHLLPQTISLRSKGVQFSTAAAMF